MEQLKYKLIIFDLDGTLINSVADLAIATNYALEQFGFPQHTEDQYRFFVGNGVNMLLKRSLPQEYQTDEWIQKMRKVMMPYYSKHCMDLTVPYSGITEMLNDINKTGIQIAVASNKFQSATTEMVKHYFPDIPFLAVLGQREGVPIKPDPTIVEEILRKADVDYSKVLYVGDTAVDIQTAKNAKITVVGVTWGFRPKYELEAENPHFIIDNIQELYKIVFF